MSLCYAKIAVELKRSGIKQCEASVGNSPARSPLRGRRKRSESSSTMQDNRNRSMVTWMCVCLVALFFVCWLPFHAVQLAKLRGIRESVSLYSRLQYIDVTHDFVLPSCHGKRVRSSQMQPLSMVSDYPKNKRFYTCTELPYPRYPVMDNFASKPPSKSNLYHLHSHIYTRLTGRSGGQALTRFDIRGN